MFQIDECWVPELSDEDTTIIDIRVNVRDWKRGHRLVDVAIGQWSPAQCRLTIDLLHLRGYTARILKDIYGDPRGHVLITCIYNVPTIPYRKLRITCSKIFTSTTLFCNQL